MEQRNNAPLAGGPFRWRFENRTHSSVLRRIRALLGRDDFRQHPLRGLFRRIAWRLRWSIYPDKPWLVRAHGAMPLLVARGGAGALTYYQGASEPETADFLKRVLKPGMVFVDVGAHLGEYTVLAAAIVKDSGCVHAFEPRPDIFEILTRNIRLNDCRNVTAWPYAVSDESARCEFEITPDPSRGGLSARGATGNGAARIKVDAVTLDHYFADSRMTKPSLIKVDVEGTELHVFKGARSLLSQPAEQAPVLIFEYEPINTKRFGYSPDEILTLLKSFDYSLYGWHRGELVSVRDSGTWPGIGSECNLIASKVDPLISSSTNGRERT